MKVKILEPAFFNNTYLNKGEIVNLNIDECPSWAEVIGKKPKAKEQEQKEENEQELIALRKELLELTGKEVTEEFTKEQLIEEIEKAKKTLKQVQGDKDTELADEAKKEYLEELLNKAFDKGILLEGTENKTVDEQIKELEELLKG